MLANLFRRLKKKSGKSTHKARRPKQLNNHERIQLGKAAESLLSNSAFKLALEEITLDIQSQWALEPDPVKRERLYFLISAFRLVEGKLLGYLNESDYLIEEVKSQQNPKGDI